MYIIIGLSVKILGFPAGNSRTHVSEAVVYATLNVVKYDVFPCARGMMYITLYTSMHIVSRGTGEEKIKLARVDHYAVIWSRTPTEKK